MVNIAEKATAQSYASFFQNYFQSFPHVSYHLSIFSLILQIEQSCYHTVWGNAQFHFSFEIIKKLI